MDVKGKRVLVVGLGKSGIASALFLADRGARVAVSDTKSEEELHHEIPQLLDRGIGVEAGYHGERTFKEQELIVISPGVSSDVPQLEQARQAGIPVIGEVELAARYLKGKIVAITGSNGKTTTTTLAGEIIIASGQKTLVGGNIGTPAISFVETATDDTWIVLEVSSFQLETIETFHPKIAVVLNVTPDHLDRHHTFANYAAAKARIFENQTGDDFAVLNADDATCVAMADKTKAAVSWFSRQHLVERGAYVRGDDIVWRDAGREQLIMPVTEIGLKGAHNVENVLAGICAGMLAGVDPPDIRRVVANFKAVEHRLEYVATIRGVEYSNDSKATNVDAAIKALESFAGGIHLILGGKDKGSDYSVLNSLLEQRVKRVYTIGAAAAKIESQIKGTKVVSSGTLDQAVRRASEAATPGDTVLLAPACASFDQFISYEHRGRVFKDLVRQIESRELQQTGSQRSGGQE
ncbi:MAG TPA: UDP-N-acetylmuramoyl-L-alanine--D-glutamate ligase [Candidatus Eisenbacteria bacterium]|nr:UDP-N-acetylmuramoyl-L-alanine--D-glutamate ligase [Candidatus Eisenbacteria bacterium]